MRPLLTPEEMAAADRACVESGTTIETLMDRAGHAVARRAIRLANGRYGKSVVVVCGKGSNGGDGIVVARVLHAEGVGVRCLCVDDPGAITGAARAHLDRLRRIGVRLEPFARERLDGADAIVDAIFGTGFRGRAEGTAAQAIAAINDAETKVIAVDIPSGVVGATGGVDGPAVHADVTVAMGAEKIGTALPPGTDLAGVVEVAHIGIATGDHPHGPWVAEASDIAGVLPGRRPDAHKRSAGSVALLGGSAGMSGAPILAARGAVRMGAGYATLGTTAAVETAASTLLPEVLSAVVTDDDVLGPEALKRFSPVIERADAVVLGPGLGVGPPQRALVDEGLASIDKPLVLDADGLNVLAESTESLAKRSAPTVITPHPGEMARLLDVGTGDVQADRLGTARAAAARFTCVVVLKGHRTITAHPDGRVVVNPTGGPRLATAGTGDVLSGAIAALLAQDVDPFAAAWAAVYVHGTAGQLVAEGAVAWDVAETLPRAVAELGPPAG